MAELQKDLSIKESRVLASQSSLDQYKTEHEEVISQYESAQKDFYEVGSEIARNEQHLQSLKTDILKLQTELQQTQSAYQESLSKTLDFENLSPKEKALHLMDDLIENIPQKFIKDKAHSVKDLLLSIFNIVIEQSKDLSKEYLEREAILQGELLKKQSLEKEVSKSLNELIQKSFFLNHNLIKFVRNNQK